ncbi:MAG: hypothetical protein Q7U37_07955 [Gallionella sp.]|nr:hypothetical protein [Gallionella sp.]
MITADGVLPIGLEFAGKRHSRFKIRPAKVRDTLDAIAEVESDSGLKFYIAVLAKQLVELGDIPKEQITAALLAELFDVDLAAIQVVQENLEKKFQPPKASLTPIG